jgi:hypothetical protein
MLSNSAGRDRVKRAILMAVLRDTRAAVIDHAPNLAGPVSPTAFHPVRWFIVTVIVSQQSHWDFEETCIPLLHDRIGTV